MATTQYKNLTELIETLKEAATNKNHVQMADIMDTIGRRSFGPIILVIGLIMAVPGVSDIPTVPSFLAFVIILVLGQLLLKQEHIWLPNWMLNRSVTSDNLVKTLNWAKKPAGMIDYFVKQRLQVLVESRAAWYGASLSCIAISLIVPVLEFVPFSANLAGLAIMLFGLAFVGDDGVMMLLGYSALASTIGLVVYLV